MSPPSAGTELPTGTVTFLFTDVEGSTRLWEQYPDGMRQAMARHDELVEACVASNSGVVVRPRGEGDSRFAVFPRAAPSVAAARDMQRALAAETWPFPTPMRVRMALHTGEAEVRGGDYYGSDVNRCARLRALAYGGQTLLSQATYDLIRDALPEQVSIRDLGEHRLKDLQRPEHIFQLILPSLPGDFPPFKSLDALPNNLPVQLTSFIGRERELKEVEHLITTTRLLTLTGSGGTGKTRLALQATADALEQFPDGAWFVELAPLADPALVPQAVATALGVREQPGHPVLTAVLDYLHTKTLLLLFDNCEHLIHACAQFAETILHSCRQVRILATSREALGIGGETAWPVPSLTIPDTAAVSVDRLIESESVRLLIERAQAVQPSFRATPANASAIAQVCQRLDGIPLAIELAAARLRVLTVEQVATHLDDRFRLLTGGSRTALPRQQTLRALIDWSYGLLSEPERRLFRRLSTFAGGWTLEAAEAVCGEDERPGTREGADASSLPALSETILRREDVLDLLTRLVDKSLVVAMPEELALPGRKASVGSSMRYRMLETIRQYARDRLLESEEGARIRFSHLDWFTRFAEQGAQRLRTRERLVWMIRFESEHDNLRAALAWAMETDTERALRLVAAIFMFWFDRGYASEGARWAEQALAHDAAEGIGRGEATTRRAAARAGALLSLAALHNALGDMARARAEAEESANLWRALGDKTNLALVLAVGIAWNSLFLGDVATAQAAAEEGLALAREAGDDYVLATALALQGQILFDTRGDVVTARALTGESISLFRRSGDVWDAARALLNLGAFAVFEGDYPKARAWLEESVALFHEDGNRLFRDYATSYLADVERKQGDYASATAHYRESLASGQEIGNREVVARCLERLAFVAARQQEKRADEDRTGLLQSAARLLGAAAALREGTGTEMRPSDRFDYDAEFALLRGQIDEGVFNSAWAEGRALTMEQALSYALKEE